MVRVQPEGAGRGRGWCWCWCWGGGGSGQWTVCVGLGEREKGGCGLLWTAVLEEGNGQLAVVVTAVVELVHLHGEGPSICLGSWTTSERRNN